MCSRFVWREIARCCGKMGRESASAGAANAALSRSLGKGEELPSQAAGLGLVLPRGVKRYLQRSGGAEGRRAGGGVCAL